MRYSEHEQRELDEASGRELDQRAMHWSGMPKGFWSYEAPDPGGPPPNMTEKEWRSLSPGMRREIKRGTAK